LDGAVVHDPVAEAAARRSLIRLELDAAVAQRRGRRLHLVDREAELVVRARRRAARREDEERSATALVEEVAVIVAYGLELEHVAVEGARTLDVPCRQLRVSAAEKLAHASPLVRSSSVAAILCRSAGSLTFASRPSSSSTRAVSRPARTVRRRRSPLSHAGSARRATAHGSGPACATAASRQARASCRSAAAVRRGMSTGTRPAASCAAPASA